MVTSIRPEVPVSTSVKSLIQGFLLTRRTEYKSPRTVEFYETNLKRFMWFAERQGFPEDARLITEWNIREFLSYVSDTCARWGITGNGSESSQRRASYTIVHHCVLKVFFNWCVSEGFLPTSPLAKVKMKNPKLGVVQPYTNQDILKLLAVCDHDMKHNATLLGSRNKAIVLMLLDTGLRASELTNIRVTDIDLERGWIKVKGKGAKERVVRIGSTTQKAVWRYLAE